MEKVKQNLSHQFEMKDLGAFHYFLGVKIIQDLQGGGDLDRAARLHRENPTTVQNA